MSVWAGFQLLSGRRGWGGGMTPLPNPISYEAIDRYCSRQGYSDDEAERFLVLTVLMDEAFIGYVVSEQAKKKPKD